MPKEIPKYYNAIITGQRRGNRVLLLDIIDYDGILFRDHCWVNAADRLQSFIPAGDKKSCTRIAFSAYEYSYKHKKGSIKKNLKKLRCISYLKPKPEIRWSYGMNKKEIRRIKKEKQWQQ